MLVGNNCVLEHAAREGNRQTRPRSQTHERSGIITILDHFSFSFLLSSKNLCILYISSDACLLLPRYFLPPCLPLQSLISVGHICTVQFYRYDSASQSRRGHRPRNTQCPLTHPGKVPHATRSTNVIETKRRVILVLFASSGQDIARPVLTHTPSSE